MEGSQSYIYTNMRPDRTRYIDAVLESDSKFCSSCNRHRKTVDGKWKVAVSGNSRRWMCGACYQGKMKYIKEKSNGSEL